MDEFENMEGEAEISDLLQADLRNVDSEEPNVNQEEISEEIVVEQESDYLTCVDDTIVYVFEEPLVDFELDSQYIIQEPETYEIIDQDIMNPDLGKNVAVLEENISENQECVEAEISSENAVEAEEMVCGETSKIEESVDKNSENECFSKDISIETCSFNEDSEKVTQDTEEIFIGPLLPENLPYSEIEISSPTILTPTTPKSPHSDLNVSPALKTLDKDQIKKRLQSFSLLKQGIQALPKKVNPKQPKVHTRIEEVYDAIGRKTEEKIVIKKPPKQGPTPSEKARAVIDEIEQIKKEEAAIYEQTLMFMKHSIKDAHRRKSRPRLRTRIRSKSPRRDKKFDKSPSPVKKDKKLEKSSPERKDKKLDIKERLRKISEGEKIPKNTEIEKPKIDKIIEKKKIDKPVEKEEMPINWTEIKTKNIDFHKIRKIKQNIFNFTTEVPKCYQLNAKRGNKNKNEPEKITLKKEEFIKPQLIFEGPSMLRTSLLASSADGKNKYFPAETIRFTEKFPNISYSENPNQIPPFRNRKQTLSEIPPERAEIMLKIIENKTSPINPGKYIEGVWYSPNYLQESKIEPESTTSYGLSVLSEMYNDEQEEAEEKSPKVHKKKKKTKKKHKKHKSKEKRDKKEKKRSKKSSEKDDKDSKEKNEDISPKSDLNTQKEDDTPDTDEYRSNWESDEDVLNDIITEDTHREYKNKIWRIDSNSERIEQERRWREEKDKYSSKRFEFEDRLPLRHNFETRHDNFEEKYSESRRSFDFSENDFNFDSKRAEENFKSLDLETISSPPSLQSEDRFNFNPEYKNERFSRTERNSRSLEKERRNYPKEERRTLEDRRVLERFDIEAKNSHSDYNYRKNDNKPRISLEKELRRSEISLEKELKLKRREISPEKELRRGEISLGKELRRSGISLEKEYKRSEISLEKEIRRGELSKRSEISLEKELRRGEISKRREISPEKEYKRSEISLEKELKRREISLDKEYKRRDISLEKEYKRSVKSLEREHKLKRSEISLEKELRRSDISLGKDLKRREISLDKEYKRSEISLEKELKRSEKSEKSKPKHEEKSKHSYFEVKLEKSQKKLRSQTPERKRIEEIKNEHKNQWSSEEDLHKSSKKRSEKHNLKPESQWSSDDEYDKRKTKKDKKWARNEEYANYPPLLNKDLLSLKDLDRQRTLREEIKEKHKSKDEYYSKKNKKSDKKKAEEKEKYKKNKKKDKKYKKNKVKLNYSDTEDSYDEDFQTAEQKQQNRDCLIVQNTENAKKYAAKIKIDYSDFDLSLSKYNKTPPEVTENAPKDRKFNIDLSEIISPKISPVTPKISPKTEISLTPKISTEFTEVKTPISAKKIVSGDGISPRIEKSTTPKISTEFTEQKTPISGKKIISGDGISSKTEISTTPKELPEQKTPISAKKAISVEGITAISQNITSIISPVAAPILLPEQPAPSKLVSEYEEFMKAVLFDDKKPEPEVEKVIEEKKSEDSESEESSSEYGSSEEDSYSDSSSDSSTKILKTVANIKTEKISDDENSQDVKRKRDDLEEKIIEVNVKIENDAKKRKIESKTKETVVNLDILPENIPLPDEKTVKIALEDIPIPNSFVPQSPDVISISSDCSTPSPAKKPRSLIPIKFLTAESRKQANETAQETAKFDTSGLGKSEPEEKIDSDSIKSRSIIPIKFLTAETRKQANETAKLSDTSGFGTSEPDEKIDSDLINSENLVEEEENGRKRQSQWNIMNITPSKKILLQTNPLAEPDSDEDFTEKFVKSPEKKLESPRKIDETKKVDEPKKESKTIEKEEKKVKKTEDKHRSPPKNKIPSRREKSERRSPKRDRSRDRFTRESTRDRDRRQNDRRRSERKLSPRGRSPRARFSRERDLQRPRAKNREKRRDDRERSRERIRERSREKDYRNYRKYSRSPTPHKKDNLARGENQNFPINMDIVHSPVNSPLDGFKRSLADSTISDSELITQLNTPDENSDLSLTYKHNSDPSYKQNSDPTYKQNSDLSYKQNSDPHQFFSEMSQQSHQSPSSPKRISLDDRINLVLGIEKEPPKTIDTLCTRVSYTNNPPQNYDPYYNRSEYDYLSQENYQYQPYYQNLDNNVKVLQVGNVIQVVPTEQVIPPPPPKTENPPKVVQVGNMLQIVPSTIIETVPTVSPIITTAPISPENKTVTPKIIDQLVAERRAEKEKRRLEREARKKEKERKRKEKEKRRQLKIKTKTENMIKRALMLETGDLDISNLDAETSENDNNLPAAWPPASSLTLVPLPKPPGKGILVTHGYREKDESSLDDSIEIRKVVKFADGVCPGEGTSPSGGEDLPSPPPPPRKLPKEKRYKKIKNKNKKKIKVKIIRTQQQADDESSEEDTLPPPPPPPGSPPPHLWPPRIKQPPVNNIHPSLPANVFPPAYPASPQLMYPPAYPPMAPNGQSVPLVIGHGPPPPPPPQRPHHPPVYRNPKIISVDPRLK